MSVHLCLWIISTMSVHLCLWIISTIPDTFVCGLYLQYRYTFV
jgi:hypothetical protein